MDDVEALLTQILTRIDQSNLSDTVKSDLYARVDVGLHSLVWPILLSHVPKATLDDIILGNDHITTDQYAELIEIALKDPSSMKELHKEIKEALEEVQALIENNLPKSQPQVSQ